MTRRKPTPASIRPTPALSPRLEITVSAARQMRALDAAELARRFGVSRWAIYKRLARAGYAPREASRPRQLSASQLGTRRDPLDLDSL